MIALCREHHDEADQGLFSNDELRALKTRTYVADSVHGEFPSWIKPNILVRVGGSYFGGCKAVVSVGGEPVIQLTKNEADMLCLSFILKDATGETIVAMEENAFDAYPSGIHDLEVATRKGSVKVWIKERDIGLDLSFKRITQHDLEDRLREDRERVAARIQRELEEMQGKIMGHLPPDLAEMIRESLSGPIRLPPGTDGLPQEIKEAHLSSDPVEHRVKSWAAKKCMADDDRIPFLDFSQLAIIHHGERVTIRNGIGGIDYCASIDNFGGVNLPCPCEQCCGAGTQF